MEETHVQALEVQILFFIQEKNKDPVRKQELVQGPDLLLYRTNKQRKKPINLINVFTLVKCMFYSLRP